MKTIHKYNLIPTEKQIVLLPRFHKIIHAGFDCAGNLCLWAEVYTDNVMEPQDIFILGTGHEMPKFSNLKTHLGTVVDSQFVRHIYIDYGEERRGDE